MRAHYLQHVPFEGLGSIENWLQNGGYEISRTQLFNSEELPKIDDIDILIVMGGPMSIHDEQEYPWLVAEKEFIRTAIKAGKPVLGICLGAQLMASSMGGEVFPNPLKEIGWFPVESVGSQKDSLFTFPEITEVFHWHGETFSLPEGAVRLAKSMACKNQAFQIGSHAIGLQFHLETIPTAAKAIVDNCRGELVEGEFIQSEAEILSATPERYSSINSLMGKILEYLLGRKGKTN